MGQKITEIYMSANTSPHSDKALSSNSLRRHWRVIVPLVLPLLMSACSDPPDSQQQEPEPVTVVEADYIEGQVIEALSANAPHCERGGHFVV
ncbi:MAG: hypothetical protein ACJAZ0_001663 [Halioglobus sp.]|jgi:hypothetical protein